MGANHRPCSWLSGSTKGSVLITYKSPYAEIIHTTFLQGSEPNHHLGIEPRVAGTVCPIIAAKHGHLPSIHAEGRIHLGHPSFTWDGGPVTGPELHGTSHPALQMLALAQTLHGTAINADQLGWFEGSM